MPSQTDSETHARIHTLVARAGLGADAAFRTLRGAERSPDFMAHLPRAVMASEVQPEQPPPVLAATLAEPRRPRADTDVMLTTPTPRPPSQSAPVNDRTGLEQFELMERIGEGGMGIVYRARQHSLGRHVALKRARGGDDDALARFVVEGRVTAWLEHPGIVPVHLMCLSDEGLPHLAMKLVRGRSWLSMLEDNTIPLQRHVEVLIAVCNAIAFAHDAGVVHRDLKPANVMVGTYGEVYVLDWGIAFATDERAALATGLSRVQPTDPPVGTPNFMAPEQIMGHLIQQGPRTDVFQLGCCLHAILTGMPRYTGADVEDVLRAAVTPTPYPYPKRLPSELVAIAIRATDPDPEFRHSTALALRDELREWLAHSQADVFVADGEASLARVKSQTAGASTDQTTLRHLFREGRAAFEAALRIWPQHPSALSGRRALLSEQVRASLRADDLPQARMTAEELGDPDLLAEVVRAENTAAERASELEALRDEQKRRSWREMAIPQSEVCLIAAVLTLATGIAVTLLTPDWTDPHHQEPAMLWLGLAVALPVIGEWRLRRAPQVARVQTNAVHLILGPATLNSGALLLVHWVRGDSLWLAAGLGPFIASVAICGLAVLWQRWLLVPAAIFAATGFLASLAGPWLMLVMSAGMALAMVTIAVALRAGAKLGPG